MESVFHISKCTMECQVKFATCTLLGGALTWWNSHVRTIRHDVAYAFPWKTLMKMINEKYSSRSKIKKLETKLWSPTAVNTQRALGTVQKTDTFYECGSQGNFKKDFL
uniref:Retrotransposon gag domain-containing protein n=1 Tax=Tanacetum cinerariifolium TaxID=118510 RepID=A0A699K6H4_TANCI|nr:hypothetical protein [Tanacetum cinerariifolium]